VKSGTAFLAQGVISHIIERQRHSLSNTMQQMEVDSTPMTPTEYMEEDRSPVPDSNAMDVSEVDQEDADLSSVAALIDQLKHEDVQLRVNACQKLTVIAAALGPERARDELIPFLDGKFDVITNHFIKPPLRLCPSYSPNRLMGNAHRQNNHASDNATRTLSFVLSTFLMFLSTTHKYEWRRLMTMDMMCIFMGLFIYLLPCCRY
jgi:hypothetical protein